MQQGCPAGNRSWSRYALPYPEHLKWRRIKLHPGTNTANRLRQRKQSRAMSVESRQWVLQATEETRKWVASTPKNSPEEQSKRAIKCTVKANLTEVQGRKNPYVPVRSMNRKPHSGGSLINRENHSTICPNF